MGEGPLPDKAWLAEELAEIHRQLDELHGARSMQATVQSGGSYVLQSEDGDLVLIFGVTGVDPIGDPTYGVRLLDSKGDIVLMASTGSEGMVYPHEYHQWIVPTPQSISSTSFVTVAECEFALTAQDVLQMSGAVITPAGSTAELRLIGAGESTDVLVVPSNANRTASFEWIHPYTVGWGDSTATIATVLLAYQARLASGAGPITVYPPRHLTFRNRKFTPLATPTGGGRV